MIGDRLVVYVGAEDELDQVLQRQDVRHELEHPRELLRGAEGTGEERHRQDDDVHHRGDRFRGADQRRHRQPEPGEGDAAQQEREQERERPVRQLRVEEPDPEGEDDDRLEREHDQVREQDRGEVERRGQRRRAKPLQDPVLAPDHERDREAAERGVRHRVADQAGDELAHVLRVALAEDGGEQHEEERREEEDEDRRLPAAPEDQLLGPQLMPEQGHAVPSPSSTSSR